MFCQKCSLHYPDHLSFCRRCGQSLVHSNAETSVESHCCTRCGARVVRGENFCQHCGNRVSVALQETVIGACYHCGTSWRSGWIYCKNCGLDRKRALLLSTSTPSPGGPTSGAQQQAEDVPEITKTNCKSCGTEAKPYSRFCEACGHNLVGAKSGTVETVASTMSRPNQSESMPSPRKKSENVYQSSPTIFEPRSLSESDKKLSAQEPKMSDALNHRADNLSSPELPDSGNLVLEPNLTAATTLDSSGELGTAAHSMPISEENGSQAKTVVTPLPPFGGEFRTKQSGVLAEPQPPGKRAFIQTSIFIALAFLLILFVYWWFTRDFKIGVDGNSSSQSSVAQPGASSTSNTSRPAGATGNNGLESMVLIPGGKLDMGRNNGDEYETPVHAVTVNPFYMDRTEVTNEEYQLFVTATGHRPPSHWRNGKFPLSEAKVPVVNVSWEDANAYAQWVGKRLPTEEEWEFAARGPDGRIYPWGNSWNAANANASKETGGSISKVGSFPNGASQFGVMDLCGNVWEWTSSSLVNYADQKEIAPGKVIRGGAYDTPSKRATATYRGVLPSDRLRDKTGFRLVKNAK